LAFVLLFVVNLRTKMMTPDLNEDSNSNNAPAAHRNAAAARSTAAALTGPGHGRSQLRSAVDQDHQTASNRVEHATTTTHAITTRTRKHADSSEPTSSSSSRAGGGGGSSMVSNTLKRKNQDDCADERITAAQSVSSNQNEDKTDNCSESDAKQALFRAAASSNSQDSQLEYEK
jgi:hypothetical protein